MRLYYFGKVWITCIIIHMKPEFDVEYIVLLGMFKWYCFRYMTRCFLCEYIWMFVILRTNNQILTNASFMLIYAYNSHQTQRKKCPITYTLIDSLICRQFSKLLMLFAIQEVWKINLVMRLWTRHSSVPSNYPMKTFAGI